MQKAIELARQSESVKKQQPTVRGQEREQMAVEAIKKRHSRQLSKNPILPSTNPAFNYNHTCTRCGQSPKHDKKVAQLRRSKMIVREVQASDDSQDELLGVIHSETDSLSSTEAPWTTNLELNGRNIEFKIDTGADVTVISE